MRAIAIAAVLAALAFDAAAGEGYVDLDRPGALDRVARENPRHYREIVKIASAASEVSCETELRMAPVPAAKRPMECTALAITGDNRGQTSVIFRLAINNRGLSPVIFYSTVTDFARLRGLSTSVPRHRAAW